MKIALCQLDSAWEDRSASARRVEALGAAIPQGTDLAVFPEMTLTGFSMNPAMATLQPEDHQVFRRLSQSTSSAVVYGGVEDGHNRMFLADGASHRPVYSKRHLFSYGGEREAYEPGGASPWLDIRGVRFGLAICYDLRFPYHFWQNAREVDAYLAIANWPAPRSAHWKALLKARAIENQAFMIGVNRVGTDPALAYAGGSSVFDPLGECMLDCQAEPGAFGLAFDPSQATAVREKFRFLEDRQS